MTRGRRETARNKAGPGAAAFQAALETVSAAAEVCRTLEAAIVSLGYSSVDYASGPVVRWPMDSNLDWRPDIVCASHDWETFYFGTEFQKHDRMLPHMIRQVAPWLYWDVWSTPPEHPMAAEIEARNRTLVQSGLSIPFHGPGLRFAGFNLGSQLSREDLEARDKVTRGETVLLASLAHSRIQALAGLAPEVPKLTDREVECLTWSARGKTAWETAAILSVSESAVRKHTSSACAKLDARTGVHAVAIALSRGLIAL